MRIEKFHKLFSISTANGIILTETAARNILGNSFKNTVIKDGLSFEFTTPFFKEGKTVWETYPMITFTRGHQRVWMVIPTREVMCFNSTDLRLYEWQLRILRSMCNRKIRSVRKSRADRKSYRKNAWEPYNQSLIQAHGTKGTLMSKALMDIIQYGMLFEYSSNTGMKYHNFQLSIPKIVELYELLGTKEGLVQCLADPRLETFFKVINTIEKNRTQQQQNASRPQRNGRPHKTNQSAPKVHTEKREAPKAITIKDPVPKQGLVHGIELPVDNVPTHKPKAPKVVPEEDTFKVPSKPKTVEKPATMRDILQELDEEVELQQNLENAEVISEYANTQQKRQDTLSTLGELLDLDAISTLAEDAPITTL